MRSVLVLISAILFGLITGYAWSAMSSPKPHARVPRAVEAKVPATRETPADRQWEERADDNAVAPAPAAPATNA